MYHQDFSNWTFPRFLQGSYLKAALTMLPQSASERVMIMVPYLVQGEILYSILQIPDDISIFLFTRDHTGYLPTVKSGAQPAITKLRNRSNIRIWINNDIHAKILLVDNQFAVIHSMNGTPQSESTNFEAGIVSINSELIKETEEYFEYVRSKSIMMK